MARPLRVEFEGALYHLTGRGNARQRIYADEADCAKFVQLLVESLDRYDVALHGYVLMGNHYHLIAQSHRPNLGRWMHWLTTAYAVYFNRRHRGCNRVVSKHLTFQFPFGGVRHGAGVAVGV
jgi:putative transposase